MKIPKNFSGSVFRKKYGLSEDVKFFVRQVEDDFELVFPYQEKGARFAEKRIEPTHIPELEGVTENDLLECVPTQEDKEVTLDQLLDALVEDKDGKPSALNVILEKHKNKKKRNNNVK